MSVSYQREVITSLSHRYYVILIPVTMTVFDFCQVDYPDEVVSVIGFLKVDQLWKEYMSSNAAYQDGLPSICHSPK